jgi:AcrR family transcriptional regulator
MTISRNETKDARSRILEAALDLFSEKGLEATTTLKIAKKAGVNEVTLFRHFKSKMALFDAVMDEVKKAGFDTEIVEDIDIPPEDIIRFAIEITFDTFGNNIRELRLLKLALWHRVEGFEEHFVEKSLLQALRFIGKAFRDLQAQNRITSKEDPELLANMLLSMMVEMATQRAMHESSPLRKLDMRSIVDSIVRLFLA